MSSQTTKKSHEPPICQAGTRVDGPWYVSTVLHSLTVTITSTSNHNSILSNFTNPESTAVRLQMRFNDGVFLSSVNAGGTLIKPVRSSASLSLA